MSEKHPRSEGKATIFDVAELAKVSIKTVSRVVNHEPNVTEKTKKKVLDAIARLNYQPNSAARGLSGKRSFVIGLIYENPDEFSYVGNVLKGALQACEDLNYSLLLQPLKLPDKDIGDKVRRFAVQTRVDGIVLPPPLADVDQVVTVLDELGIPFAALAPKHHRSNAINLVCEDRESSCALTEHFIELGHREIGFIQGHPDHGASDLRFGGYKDALKKHGITFKKSLVKQGYFDFESGKKCAAQLLNLKNPPTVIVASNDDMAAGAMFIAQQRGMLVPEEISVAGFDDTPLASHLWPTLTTVKQPITEMAVLATTLLINKLSGESEPEETVSFHCDVVIRKSSQAPQ